MMKPQPNDRTHILSYQTFAPTKEKPPNFEANIEKKKKDKDKDKSLYN